MPFEKAEIDTQEPRILQLADIEKDLSEVRTGDTVTGFQNLEQFDAFIATLVDVRFGRLHRADFTSFHVVAMTAKQLGSNSGKMMMPIWGQQHKLPSEALKPKKIRGKDFHGKLVNQSVTLLDENIVVNPNTERIDRGVPQVVVLLLDAQLTSTGRGIIGRSFKMLEVVESPRPHSPGLSRRVTYSSVEGDTADSAFEFLAAESNSGARLMALTGLKRAYSAGLPGLGKP